MKKFPRTHALSLRVVLLLLALTTASCVGSGPASYSGIRSPAADPVHSILPTFHPRDDSHGDGPPMRIDPGDGPIELTVHDAVIMALANNRSLEVERLAPAIGATFEEQEAAVFDPVLESSLSTERIRERRPSTTGGLMESRVSDLHRGSISLKKFFPSGTRVTGSIATERSDSDVYPDPYAATRLGITVTQALLRGWGSPVNLARLRQSRLETAISAYELRGVGEHLAAEVEQAYWDYALALRRIEIYEESLKLAEQQMEETLGMIEVGAMAEAELAAVQAEVAAQRQGIIDARSAEKKAKLRLLQLVNLPGSDPWSRNVEPIHPPELPRDTTENIEDHVAVALERRPEMRQAELSLKKGELEIVRTRNGLLPLMDLFVTLGKSGYADSFGRSMEDVDGRGYDVGVGVTIQYPLFNRDAAARYRRAQLELQQTRKAMENLAQLIELDVRTAHIEVGRTRDQIAASIATREFQEEKLRSETEKFRVGRSTNFLVAQAQRDLLVSRINEVEAVVSYLKALVNFYRLEGSLLDRRGIEVDSGKGKF